jgi:import receptor subunit TOM70
LALKRQEYDDVIPLCIEELNNLDPDDNSLHKLKVLLLKSSLNFVLGGQNDTIADLTTIIDSNISTQDLKINALIKRANLYVQIENITKCFEDFIEAEKIDPLCSDIYYNRAQVKYMILALYIKSGYIFTTD